MLFLMKLALSHGYRCQCDCWQLLLNRDKEMQNVHVKTLDIANCCGLSSLIKPDTVRHALCNCVKMDLWLIKQFKRVEIDTYKLGTASSTVGAFLTEKESEKILNGLSDIQFYLSTLKWIGAFLLCCAWQSSDRLYFQCKKFA
jgi:hypothetical protein